MKGPSLRVRLTVWYAAGLGVTLLGFGVLVDRTLVGAFQEEFEERLTSAAGVVAFALRDMAADVGPRATADRLLQQLRFVEVGVAISGRAADGAPLQFQGNDSGLAQVHTGEPCRERPMARQQLGGTPYRFLVQCISVDGSQSPFIVIVGASERELVATRDRVRTTFILALLVGLLVTVIGGHWLSGKAIAPIRRMGARVREIGSENLEQRLPVAEAEGEIADLTSMVNALFDRLAATLDRERRFLANAAHALRTPVAVLQGEVAKASRRHDFAEIEALVGHLGRTVDYLLALARRDAGAEPIIREPLFLDDVVSGTVARLGRMAVRRGVHLAWGELTETSVVANPHMADMVAQILLENALRYTPAGGTVTISVAPQDGAGWLIVEDTGPGLASEDLAALFTPFVRGTAARQSGTAGSGLGLAVAQWMVKCCGGSISAERAQQHEGGARFVVRLPSSPR